MTSLDTGNEQTNLDDVTEREWVLVDRFICLMRNRSIGTTSVMELWDRIKAAAPAEDMTDEEATDLALEAQRWAREQLRSIPLSRIVIEGLTGDERRLVSCFINAMRSPTKSPAILDELLSAWAAWTQTAPGVFDTEARSLVDEAVRFNHGG
jgi:hypothetical protein